MSALRNIRRIDDIHSVEVTDCGTVTAFGDIAVAAVFFVP